MFFYSVLFKNFVYVAKYPIMILLLMLMVTLMSSMIIMNIENVVSKMEKQIFINEWR